MFIVSYVRSNGFKNAKEVEECYQNLIKGLDEMHERRKGNNVVQFKKKERKMTLQERVDRYVNKVRSLAILEAHGTPHPEKVGRVRFQLEEQEGEVEAAITEYRALLEEAELYLRCVLPMAKGYAHHNSVGTNLQKIRSAEETLTKLNAALGEK